MNSKEKQYIITSYWVMEIQYSKSEKNYQKQKLERFALYEQDKQIGFNMIIKTDLRNY